MLVTCAGILVVGLIAAHLPKVSDPGELIFAPEGIEVHMGGHAGNVSIDLRKLGLKQGEVSSIGAVGEDVFGDFLEKITFYRDKFRGKSPEDLKPEEIPNGAFIF